MDGLVKQLIDTQHKNEERYIEVEEKRIQLEERPLEKELEMQQESRQSQMKMMQMMSSVYRDRNITTPIIPFPPPVSSSTQYSGSPISSVHYCASPYSI